MKKLNPNLFLNELATKLLIYLSNINPYELSDTIEETRNYIR